MKASLLQAAALTALATLAHAQVPAGGEFQANTFTTHNQEFPRAAMEPDGDFVVVWTSNMQDGSGTGVFGQRFATSGARRGAEFPINTYTTGFQRSPAVTVGPRGDFVVVWESVQYLVDRSVRGQRFDAAGAAVGGEFLVNSSTGYHAWSRIGRAADGRFVVSWARDVGGSSYAIVARRFEASGDPIGADFVVNTYTTGLRRYPDIAVGAGGDFVVVWDDHNNDRDGSGTAIFGQRFDASGTPLASEFQVNTYTSLDQRFASVSISPTGGFVVAWTSEVGDGYGYAMRARRFDAAGSPVGDDFLVNTYTTGFQASRGGQIAHDALGNFVVSWFGPGDGSPVNFQFQSSFAQRFDASGARRGGEFRVNAYTTMQQYLTSAVSDAVGNFVVVWESFGQDAYNFAVIGQRFGGLGPVALAVDTAANQVLEPGETVDVRPTWRNVNGTAQTFGGTVTNITGPAGAIYTITDPVGDYGTVANGSTPQCIDCYAVSVSNPPTRPATHWDASAVESIVPDAQGQQKQWLLHVGNSFNDVQTANPFYRFIETLLHHGVSSGCAFNLYCPAASASREQMAVFVLVAKEGVGYLPPACGATPMFSDVPASSPFCRWIEELARRGVVSGCGGGNYCPSSTVTREQMAVFVLRTLDPSLAPPACTNPIYNDVPASSPFCRWIEELTRRNVVTGCGGGNYCPAAPVTREQMSVFISVTFGLTLYGP